MKTLIIPLIAGILIYSASIGGRYAPDKTEIQIDYPDKEMLKNRGGKNGAGLCVGTSITMASRWQNEELLVDFQKWLVQFDGGGWPDQVDRRIAQIAKERGMPIPEYIQVTGGKELFPLLKEAMKSNRMVCVTYDYSPTGRYGGSRIAHMVNLVHFDDKGNVGILDNNYVGASQIEWMSEREFAGVFGRNGWAIIILSAGPPNLPFN